MREDLITLANKSPKEFMLRNGDMFVSKIYTGGEVYAYLKLHARDEIEKQKNEQLFKSVNSYLGNKLSLERKVVSTKEEKSSANVQNAYIFTTGGQATPVQLDMDTFLDYASNFKSNVGPDQKPMIMFVELSPYESLPNFPEFDFSPIRIYQKNFLEIGSLLYTELEKSLNNAIFVKDNPRYFDKDDLKSSIDTLGFFQGNLMDLTSQLDNCRNSFENCSLENLDYFQAIESFEPVIDYPYNIQNQVKLVLVIGKSTVIEQNTNIEGNQNFLIIDGTIKSRVYNNDTVYSCKDPTYNYEYKWIGTKKKVKKRFLRKTSRWSYPIYSGYSKPYYLIKFLNPQTDEILREIRWTGMPIALESNVKVTAELMNPNRAVYYEKPKGLLRQEKIKAYQYTENGAMYDGLQECEPLTAIISDNSKTPTDKAKINEISNKMLIFSNPISTGNNYAISKDVNSTSNNDKLVRDGVYYKYNFDN